MTETSPAKGRVWTLSIMAPCEWILANRNSAHHRYTRSRLTRKWRQAVVDCCKTGGLPNGDNRLELIDVAAIARFRGRAPVIDRENLRPTLKAAIDGLTPAKKIRREGHTIHVPGWGLIPDDNDEHLAAGTDIRIGDPLPKFVWEGHPGLLIITITELIPANALF